MAVGMQDCFPVDGVRVITVVIADDEPLMRSGLRMCLGAEPDIEVVGEARDGREAVAMAERSDRTSCPWTSGCRTSTVWLQRNG